ncbi:hypothetical protein E2N92_00215 [Methanofollis formosanus]|uniref:Phospholipase C n=1 Tax=Methanofollis formosanus TaxID=299308 RepID=A0A8G0ZW62_9EURY|nr:hypothetical protein [Methanofollis formosanus]QYZ77959.1 hypothetical protein E2N92_00215 [Methanofollis formosanus]
MQTKCRLGAIIALMIAGTFLVSAVSASIDGERYGPIEPEHVEPVDDHFIPSFEEKNYVITAIESSSLSEDEKDDLINNLEKVWSLDPNLSESERNEIINQASLIVLSHYRIDSNIRPFWSGYTEYNADGTHNVLAETAGQNMGLSSQKCRILNENSADPDTWGIPQMVEHYSWGGAGKKTQEYANRAAAVFMEDPNDPQGYEYLSWAMHYMSDVANPWHTQQLWAQGNHETYEKGYVLDEMVSGHNFKQVITNAPLYYYEISSPAESAGNLADFSSRYFSYIDDKINNDPDWKNDPTVVEYTEDVLEEALRYNMGLVDYAVNYS